MTKKMYSFRLDEKLIHLARDTADKLDISLSSFITMSIKDKLASLGLAKDLWNYRLVSNRDPYEAEADSRMKIVEEIGRLRADLNKFFESFARDLKKKEKNSKCE
ncbi:MAG: hypothetical protein H5T85_01800 [Actinobacteria bacterium]|nr:hypothetical protein [Actinomycetota bacterium]